MKLIQELYHNSNNQTKNIDNKIELTLNQSYFNIS